MKGLCISDSELVHLVSSERSVVRNHHRVQAYCNRKAICVLQEFLLASFRACAQLVLSTRVY